MKSASGVLLEMRDISKRFSGTRALNGVSFDLRCGEIHAIVGENGAGKSTLIKILGGVYPHSEHDGEIRILGEAKKFCRVQDSAKAGIAVVHQEIPMVPEMNVAENISLGHSPQRWGIVQWNQLHSTAADALQELGLRLDPRTPVRDLGVGLRQMVEIAKALSRQARILVLDEPTAALGDAETHTLCNLLCVLRERGLGIIYISHRLEEVFEMSDRISVLRDGSMITTQRTRDLNPDAVISIMVGHEMETRMAKPEYSPGNVVLEARHVTARDRITERIVVNDVSFSVKQGEILGIAGLVGAGRSELLMSLYGAYRGQVSAEFRINGADVSIREPSDAIQHGISLVTEDRKRDGLALDHSILHNMTITALPRLSGRFMCNEWREIAECSTMLKRFHIKAYSLFTRVAALSGGNQQKVVFSKCLLTEPRVLLLDEPTRGIDIGAKQEIHLEIEKLAKSGMAVVLVSSELSEILRLSDRILVLSEGRLAGQFTRATASPEAVMACAAGAEMPLGQSSAFNSL